ncbi:hypothetical protein G7Y89_g8334 [Cudoniella acicularis]|uniref:NADH-cytochrome b5 reductase 1 n=1 Tax=Cudoniella acicularis TaxID=354080 RepID=A0A8H4RGT4_9HELO|nr:hypothetical protein G7Y89_g8334 [Cudoniella acicularis]
MGEVKEIPMSEVLKHKTKEDLWIIVHHNVYDVSKYLEDHPGGADSLLEVAGQNATVSFEDVGHSSDARETMEHFLIGRLEGASEEDDDEQPQLPMPKPNIKPADVDFHTEAPIITAGRTALKVALGGSGIFLAYELYARAPRVGWLHHQHGGFWHGVLLSSVATLSAVAGAGLYLEKLAQNKTPYSYPAHFKPTVYIAKPITKVKGYLKPEEYQKLPLVQKNKLSPNTYRFIFKLPTDSTILGLPIGQHISIRAEVDGKVVSRSYTPVSNNSDPGELRLVIKIYPDGELTGKYLQNLQIGDQVEVRGPKGAMRYRKGMVKEIGMIAGGTGITPMYQLIRAICEDPTDKTHVSLLYGNNSESDILLREKLNKFAEKYSHNFEVYYVLSDAPEGWKLGKGYVTKEMVQQKFPEPGEDSKALLSLSRGKLEAYVAISELPKLLQKSIPMTLSSIMAPPHLPTLKTRPVAILGGGVLGRRIATCWAAGGYNVHIRDPSPEQRNAALHYIENNVSSYASSIPSLKDTTPGKAHAFENLEEAVKDAWTVIEAVPENIKLKIETFKELERVAEKDAVLVSNSSSYKSSEIVGEVSLETKRRVMNTHYMMPPDNRMVELMTDGETDEELFPWYAERLREVGMSPFIAQKESTGFIFNRVWAAIKREVLTVLAEGVSTPDQIDQIWMQMFGGVAGPCAMMDSVGLDTVQFIEKHYVQERGLSPGKTVDFLEKNFISQGKLGAKSGKGGLHPAGYTTKTTGESQDSHHNLHAPSLYMLDIGLNTIADPTHSGRILVGSPDGKNLRTLVTGQSLPDGLDISLKTGRIYWTTMGGSPSENDGMVQSCKLDGSDIQTVIAKGSVHTPKQLIIDQEANKLYFCDREGLRVMRSNLDGSEHEVIIQIGDWEKKEDAENQLNWPVGISINKKEGKFYWTQKGLSKGNRGRIFRASLEMPKGENASDRSDIEVLFSGLPEPIDLEVDEDTQILYWTDRGDPPFGNSLNSAKIDSLKKLKEGERNPKYEILSRQLHEAIGLKLDQVNKHVYLTDLGGTVYIVDMDGKNKKKVYDEECSFSGIGLAFKSTPNHPLPFLLFTRSFFTSTVAMTHERNNIINVTRQSPPVDTTEPYDASRVAGKTIVITGGASGFGEGFFRRWAENGANVIIGDVSDVRGRALVNEVRKTTASLHHHYLHCDVTNWQSQVDFFREAEKLSPHGSIDAVVANAGISDLSPAWDNPPATLDTLEEPPAPSLKCLEVNLIGVMYTAHLAMHFLPKTPKNNFSLGPRSYTPDRHLLLVGSVASLAPLPTQLQYCAAKHGVLGLFRSLRATSFVKGVRVNAILPYFIDTPLIPVAGRVILAGSAMGKPEDVVDAATRLMADSSIVGRALAIGPKVKIDDEWQLTSNKNKDGTERAVWEAYADDFEEVDVFTARLPSYTLFDLGGTAAATSNGPPSLHLLQTYRAVSRGHHQHQEPNLHTLKRSKYPSKTHHEMTKPPILPLAKMYEAGSVYSDPFKSADIPPNPSFKWARGVARPSRFSGLRLSPIRIAFLLLVIECLVLARDWVSDPILYALPSRELPEILNKTAVPLTAFQPPESGAYRNLDTIDTFQSYKFRNTCNVSSLDLHAPFSPFCRDRFSMLVAMSSGGRIGHDAPYMPRYCNMRWFSTEEICDILGRFDRVVLVGDSMLRHVMGSINILVRKDLGYGAVTDWDFSMQERKHCFCNEQFDVKACSVQSIYKTAGVLKHDPGSLFCPNPINVIMEEIVRFPIPQDELGRLAVSSGGRTGKTKAFIFGHGLWSNLDLQKTVNWLDDVLITIKDTTRSSRLHGLFLTPNAAGKEKPDEWIVTQGNKALMLFEEAVSIEANRRGIEHLGTWNMSIQSNKYDGVHLDMKATILRNNPHVRIYNSYQNIMGDEISSAHLHFPESFRPKPKPDAQNSARTAPMKILVFGLMRTGTFSMREALLKLGIHDVYHMRNIIDKPTDVRLWLQAFGAKYHMKGDFGMAEWEKLLGGCQAVTDVPAACFAEELIALYPDAKVILLERPVDTWYESCIHTVMKPREKSLIMQALLYLDWDHLGQMITLKQTIYGNFFGEGGLEESNVKRIKALKPLDQIRLS